MDDLLQVSADFRTAAICKLKQAAEVGKGDPEASGSMADTALCELLKALGYADVVEAYNDVPRWYA